MSFCIGKVGQSKEAKKVESDAKMVCDSPVLRSQGEKIFGTAVFSFSLLSLPYGVVGRERSDIKGSVTGTTTSLKFHYNIDKVS